jgi:hypothetical protein
VWRAAQRLGIGIQAAPETDGLLAVGAMVTFRHPLADATDPEPIPIAAPGISCKRRRGFDDRQASE